MDTLQAIRSRRSIRQFSPEPLSEHDLESLLAAAMQAPSALDERPWAFVVVTAADARQKLAGIHPGAAPLAQAPAVIAVCGDTHREKLPGFWVQDVSAATQNLLLAAHAQGFGAVWVGAYPMEEPVATARAVLALPEHVQPVALVAVGRPGEEQPPEDRYDTSRIHQGTW